MFEWFGNVDVTHFATHFAHDVMVVSPRELVMQLEARPVVDALHPRNHTRN